MLEELHGAYDKRNSFILSILEVAVSNENVKARTFYTAEACLCYI